MTDDLRDLRRTVEHQARMLNIERANLGDLTRELHRERERADRAEAERDEIRDTLNATMVNFEDYVGQLRDAEAERDALNAATNRVRDRLDWLIANGFGARTDTLQDLRDALAHSTDGSLTVRPDDVVVIRTAPDAEPIVAHGRDIAVTHPTDKETP